MPLQLMEAKYANPWQTLSTRIVYENAWIRVREDQVIQPDGNPSIYGVVEFHGCVGVLPIDANGNVHLVGQYRYPLQQYSWEIPEGGCHLDESPLEAAARANCRKKRDWLASCNGSAHRICRIRFPMNSRTTFWRRSW